MEVDIFSICFRLQEILAHFKKQRINLQEFKAQEVAKLQNSLQEMKRKVDETNALLLKERENAIKAAIEVAPPVTNEAKVLVEDGETIKTLKMEIEILKILNIKVCNMMYFLLVDLRISETEHWEDDRTLGSHSHVQTTMKMCHNENLFFGHLSKVFDTYRPGSYKCRCPMCGRHMDTPKPWSLGASYMSDDVPPKQ
ncbi:myosin-H heavy chain-like protein [Trifolium pratense]|uniref:Myosin-H heavy chain-like protein n=1 Tax=Trifolium pratense TaxID=57577 RepID=A0A2K3NW97_TRIPR|nr:myosin-H heavy chain-like protein [Trifolium pratense]